MTELRVGATGGRDYGRYDPTVPLKLKKKRLKERKYIIRILDGFKKRNAHRELRFCVGDATGVDAVVYTWCKDNGVRVKRYKANWKKYGKSAGPRRNRRMLDKFKPTLLQAFPGGSGTANCVAEARKRDILVYNQPGIMPNYTKREAKLAEKKKSKKGKTNDNDKRKSVSGQSSVRDRAGSHVPETRKHRPKLFRVRD